MSRNYDNWERLVNAVLRREQMWQLFHQDSRSPSIRSEASSSNSSSYKYSSSSLYDLHFEFSASSIYPLQPELVFVQDFTPAFDFMDLMNASMKLLGNGMVGSTYSAAMDNGITILVKEIKLAGMSEAQFKRHMEIVGNIRHKNVVPLRAYFYSKYEALLLYDCYSNGSVYAFSHGRTPKYQTLLYWEIRIKILLGAARGVAHIHTQRGRNLVHGNIKASNILLNSEQYGSVSEFGLANIISATITENAQFSAPEVKNLRDVTQESDVHSFGILLLELLTQDSHLHNTSSHKASDLISWVYSVKRKDWNTKLFYVDLLKYPDINEQMVKMLQIGLSCVAKAPKKRPKMSAIVKMIEDVRVMNKDNYPLMAVSHKKLVFLDGLDHGFDLDELLVSSAEVLGSGKFWTSYKVISDSGTSFVVKRLKEVNMTDEEFLQHIKVVGSLRHENVGELKAYYCGQDKRLVVYEYHILDSLSARLHGKRFARSNLGWKNRLRAALGASRGISYIHTQVGEKLVHGNIKASNIFFNSQWYGCIRDLGLPMSMNQITVPVAQLAGYAPEIAHTKTLSQASDVYSFGVVLLQLVSGKPVRPIILRRGEKMLVNWIQSFNREEWTSKVFDPELEKPENNEGIERLLQIGLDCVASVPEHRPKIAEVVKMLEDII